MYISKLLLNNKNITIRKELSDMYNFHRFISHGFDGNYEQSNFLYNIGQPKNIGVEILLYSNINPNWGYINSEYLLAPPLCKYIDPYFNKNGFYNFQLRSNPTFKNENNKRVGIYDIEEQEKFLLNKGRKHGFSIVNLNIIPEGILKSSVKNISMYSVLYNGILKVEDPVLFKEAFLNGIGRGKKFGFGMLLVSKSV